MGGRGTGDGSPEAEKYTSSVPGRGEEASSTSVSDHCRPFTLSWIVSAYRRRAASSFGIAPAPAVLPGQRPPPSPSAPSTRVPAST
jgi:hypothetical protein